MEIRRLHDVDISRLRVFMAVVESGGFAAAQAELGVSPATISVRMSELEQSLGARLCHRGRSGFRLTPDGQTIYRECERLFLAHEQFRDSVNNLQGLLTGELKVGLIDNLVFDPDCPVSAALDALCSRSQELVLTVYTMEPLELQRAVIDRRVHLAIGVFYKKIRSLNFEPLFTEKMALYCGRGHPLFDRSDESIVDTDVEAADCIERTYGQTTNNLSTPLKLNAGAFSSSLEAAVILVLSGRYIGFLPEYYARFWQRQNQLRPIAPDRYYYESEICVVTRNDQRDQPLVTALADILHQGHTGPGADRP